MLLFADDAATWSSAGLGALMLLTTIAQTWWQRREARIAAEELKKKTEMTAAVLATKVDDVHDAVNGGGLGKAIADLTAKFEAHIVEDAKQWTQISESLKHIEAAQHHLPTRKHA